MSVVYIHISSCGGFFFLFLYSFSTVFCNSLGQFSTPTTHDIDQISVSVGTFVMRDYQIDWNHTVFIQMQNSFVLPKHMLKLIWKIYLWNCEDIRVNSGLKLTFGHSNFTFTKLPLCVCFEICSGPQSMWRWVSSNSDFAKTHSSVFDPMSRKMICHNTRTIVEIRFGQ